MPLALVLSMTAKFALTNTPGYFQPKAAGPLGDGRLASRFLSEPPLFVITMCRLVLVLEKRRNDRKTKKTKQHSTLDRLVVDIVAARLECLDKSSVRQPLIKR